AQASVLDSEIVGVRAPTDRQQHVRSADTFCTGRTFSVDRDAISVSAQADAVGVQTHVDLFFCKNVADRFGYLRVFMVDETVRFFDDRDRAAKTAKHLGELQPHVTPADDDQVTWYLVEVENRAVGQERNTVDAGHCGDAGAAANVEEDTFG